MKHVYLLVFVSLLALTERVLMKTTCGPGYSIDRTQCIDYDECEDEEVPICGDNAVCYNTNGSYYCHCQKGFNPPGNFKSDTPTKCQDINECSEYSIDCGPNASCQNTVGNYSCTCDTGYYPNNNAETFMDRQGVRCIDRNECEEDSGLCGINARCHNTPGSYYCTCASGFRLRSGQTNFTDPSTDSCETDKCYADKSICGEGVCKNSNDGHECECNPGFTNYGHKQMKCTELKCDTCSNDLSKHPELTNIGSLMTKTYLSLSGKKELDGESFLKAFLDALDDLLSKKIKDNSAVIITQIFAIVESMLKLIGPMLNNNQTKMSANQTEVDMWVKWGGSPPDGPLMMSANSTQFTSNWKTATGKPHLGFTTAALLGYKSLEKSLNSYFDNLKKPENIKYEINSKVVTVVVSNAETKHLQEPVTLTFSHLKQMNVNHTCVFWDHELGDGGWSTRNCTTVRSDANETVCNCTHLSSFAVLMALYDIGYVYELHVITCVGLPISLICLLICIATFYLVRSIQCTRNTIHLHLCITLFIAYFIFLVGITRTENKVGCAVVAGMLHYFFLSAFCWMCLEGVQLFRMVVLVFNTTVRHIYLVAAGYGVPAVIVAISAAVNKDGYGTEQHCWLNLKDGFIWSFYGPVCVIVIVNVFFFLITIWKLAEKFSSLNPDLNNLRKIRTFTITAIAQMCVLGIMWVFGCFQFDEATLPMSYIFTILGCLQGVMMFVIHCCLSKQVRDEYVKYLASVSTPQKRKYSEFNSNQTSKSQTSKSVQNTGESSI
ncbi:adhesion G protein-coupled receptor E5 isoform X2 [Paramisgurnus dabryanus]|uniref:adhesion G protein-coupled receptor E5 isoform X2 n=1 Tax=Paramisgurnus dabryanus TaxID=90735 RepID=UPI0031F3F857